MSNTKPHENLYNALNQQGYDIGDLEQFTEKLKDAQKRHALYDSISTEFNIGDFDNFENTINYLWNNEDAHLAGSSTTEQPSAQYLNETNFTQPVIPEHFRQQSTQPTIDPDVAQNMARRAELTFQSPEQRTAPEVIADNAQTLANPNSVNAPTGLNASAGSPTTEQTTSPSEGRVEGSSPSMNNPQLTEGAVGGIKAPTTSPSVKTGTMAQPSTPSGLRNSTDPIHEALSQNLIDTAYSSQWQRDTEQHYKSEKERLQALYNKELAKTSGRQFSSSFMDYNPSADTAMSRDASLYSQALQYINDAEHHMSNVRNDAGLAQGVSDAIFDIDTLTLGLDSLSKNATLKAILDKADANQPLTEAEESLLNAALYKQFTEAALPNGRWYNVGKGIGEQVPYMLEFALSAGVAGALTKGASKAIGKQVVKYINNLALKNGSKIANRTARNIFTRGSRMLGNTLSQLPGGVMRAAVQVPLRSSVYNDIIERQIGTLGYSPSASNSEANTPPLPEGIGEVSRSDGGVNSRGGLQYTGRIGADNTADAITKGLTSGFITNLTETIGGEGIQFITNKIGGLMGKGANAIFKNLQSPRWYNRLRESFRRNGFGEFVKATSWQGPVAEYGEELLDQTLNAIFVGDSSLDPNSENYVFNLDNLIDTAITTGAISLFMGAAGGIASGKIHRDINKAFAQAEQNLHTLHYTDTEINALNNIATSRPQEASKWVSSITRTMRTLAIRSAEIENSLSPEARTLLAQPYTEAEFNELSPYDQQAVMALAEINNRFNDLTIQRDYVVAGINYNALSKGIKESVAPQAEAAMADIQANALRDSDYTIAVDFRGQKGYLVTGNAEVTQLPNGALHAELPAGSIYQIRTKSPDGQWVIQQAVAEDIVPGTVTPTQQLIDETTARIYTPVQNLINAEQAQAQAEVAQSTEQTTPTTEQTELQTEQAQPSVETTPTGLNAPISLNDSPPSEQVGEQVATTPTGLNGSTGPAASPTSEVTTPPLPEGIGEVSPRDGGVDTLSTEAQPLSTEAQPLSTEFEGSSPRTGTSTISTQAKLAHIASWQQAIDVPIVIFHDISEVDNPQAVANIQAGNRTPGWFTNGTVYIYLPHAIDERDIDATIMHECIAHFGLPRLFATQEQADAFYNEVWNAMPEAEQRRYLNYPGVSHLKGEEARRAAADEYIAHLAEQIRAKRAGEAEVSLWQRIVAFFRNALRRANVNLRINDTDLTRLLLQSLDALKKNNEQPQDTTPDNALDPNEVAVTLPSNGTETRFSIRSFREEGRAKVTNWLNSKVADKEITRQEAQDIIDQLDTIYDICQEYTTQYAPFGYWSEAQVDVDANGNPVLSVIKSNGEYAMNLDFSLVCKKRRTLDAVFQEMIARDIINDFELDGVQVAKVNEIIRSYGFETACRLCFVDAKRFRIAAVADTFVELFNEISSMSDRKLRQVISTEPTTVRGKAAQLLLNDPSQRIKVSRSDFMSAEGFERIKRDYPEIMKLYNAKKGTGGPKASFGDVQYLNDIESTSWTPDKAYAVGGVRLQSFSDYVPRMVFDYVQMIADLAAKRLPVHAYTKEDIFAKQFGLTGIKINLSLVPRVDHDGMAPGLDRDGNYVWQEGETFPYDTAIAIQNAPGYRDNCGTIAVGVSDAHILKMLDDENIRMVIPYHKSGLNPAVAIFNNIDAFVDYTNEQNTRYESGSKLSKEDLKTHFNFNEALRMANGNPRIAAQQYLDWCRENNYLPKFDKFASHPNYYKLLEDFTTMYTVDGVDTVVPQHAVEMRFPTEQDAFGSMRDLIAEGLEADAILEGQRNEQLPAIVDEIAATLPPKTKTKTKAKTKAKTASTSEVTTPPLPEGIGEVSPRDGGVNTQPTTGTSTYDQVATTPTGLNAPDTRFRFIGEQGAANLDRAEEATARLDNLAVARDMEQAGKDERTIKLATGWERGADNLWRYEVPDVFNIQYPSVYTEFHRYIELNNKFYENSSQLTSDEMEELDKLSTLFYGGQIPSITVHLRQLIDDYDLFDAYPLLINTTVNITDTKGEAYYSPISNQISIDSRFNKNEFEHVLAHEIQHAIQGVEGFARGGNKNTAEKTYHRLAGEVEARNVQRRLNLTPEERAKTLATETEDVAREDQIFISTVLGNSLTASRLNKYKVEKIFGGIWIRTKQEFAKFASAVENYAFEEDGEGIAYTDNFLYAYYWNIDGQPIPYASVYLNREQSQDIVNQVNQEIKDGRKDKRAKEYIDTAIERAWIPKTTNNVNNGNNNSLSNRARHGRLDSNLLRKGRFYDNPSLYVKTQRPDNSQQLTSTPSEEHTSFRSISPDESLTDYARAVVANTQSPAGLNAPVALATANDKNKLPGTPIRFRMTRRTESTVNGWIKRRTDLTPDEREAVIQHIDNLDGTALQLATAKWFAQGTIRIPEDNVQVEQAIKVAARAKVDPLAYDYPQAIISAFPEAAPKQTPINPDDVPTLHDKQELPNGLTVYTVDESRESQEAVREIINTHLGNHANPWCVTSAIDNQLTDESWEYWQSYTSHPKRIAFHNGKVVAFFASDNGWKIWWDTQDRPHFGIPFSANITDGEYNEDNNTIDTYDIDGKLISSVPADNPTPPNGPRFRSINPDESLTHYARAIVANTQSPSGSPTTEQTTSPSEGRVEGSSPSMNNPQQTEGAVGGIEAPTTSPSVQTGTSADTALGTIEQATADYADSLNAEREAIIDAITPTPDDSPRTIAEKTRFRSVGGELVTRDNTELEDFLALANNISNAMAENDARHKHTAIAESQYDSMQRLHNLIDDLRKQGALIDERFDPWLTQNQSRSRAQATTKVFDLTYRQPLYEAIARGIRRLFPGINTKDKAENAKGYSHLSLYAQARTAIERQEIKSAQARAEAEEKGEEYKERDFGGLAGIQEAIFGLYSAIDEEVENAKGNREKLTELAIKRGIPTVKEFVDNAEAKLGNPDINGTAAHQLWTAIRSISEYKLATSYLADITSRAGYQTLTYGRNIDALLRERYDMQVKQIKDHPDSYDNVTDYDSDGNATGTRKVLNDNARIALANLNQEYIDAINAVPMPSMRGDSISSAGSWQQLIDTGWLTEEEVNALHSYYMFYMPLKGHAELTAEDINQYQQKTPRNQSKIKAVKGHSHLAKDPFNQLILDTHGVIQSAEQNRWRLNLYNILTNNPNPSQYVVEQRFYKVETKTDGSKEYVPYGTTETINGVQVFIPGHPTAEELANGTAVAYSNRNTRADVDIPISSDQRKEHSVTVLVGGEAYTMFFYDKRIADAINGTNIKRPSDWWKQLDKLQALNRLYAGLKTSLNPTFTLISNLPRDWMEMVSNNLIEHGFAHAVTSLIYRVRATRAGDVQKAIRKHQEGKLLTMADATTDVERYVVEFFNNGGSVNITQLPDYNTAKVELMDDLNTYMRTGEMPKGGWLSRSFNDMAERVELAPRIATYIASRKLGHNISQSVNDAKEATVNFDRKGSWSGIMGMFQLFYNAAAQSVRRQIGLARRHPVRFAATYATIGFLSPLNNILMSYIMSILLGDDDDLEDIVRNYFAINPELRRRYNIILIGNDYIRIPMAVNYLPYVTLGDVIANWRLNPNYRPNVLKDTLDIASAILDTFLPSMIAQPIGFMFDAITAKNNEESANASRAMVFSLLNKIPVIEPLMQAFGNYNFMGSTLFDIPYDKNSQEPAYLRARQYTQPVWVWASHLLNDITGGNEVHAGWLNIAPEQIENVMTVFGGYGEYAENIISLGIETVSILSGEKPDTEVFKKSFPMLSRLYGGNTQERYDKSMQSMFYDDTTALAQYAEYRENATTASTRADFDRTYSPDEQRYFADLATMESIAKKIRKEIKSTTPEGEAPKYHEDERLKAIYNLANEQFHSLATGEYKPIDDPYYTYMYIKDAIEKTPYRTADGSYRLLDISGYTRNKPQDDATHIDVKENVSDANDKAIDNLVTGLRRTTRMFNRLPSGYYPGIELDKSQAQDYQRFQEELNATKISFDAINLNNLFNEE